MRATPGILAITMALFLAASLPTSPATAQLSSTADDPPRTVAVASSDEPGVDRWWGVMGAAICGGGIAVMRSVPGVGLNPWVLAPTLGGCILMLMDAAT